MSKEEVPWLSDAEAVAWRHWIEGTNRIARAIEHDLRSNSGLTMDDYEVLVRLSEAPEHRLRLTQLGDDVGNTPSQLSQRLDRMAKRGLVTRKRCQEDGRGFWAVLTPDGLAELAAAAPDHVRSVRRHLIDKLSAKDLRAITDLMGRLARP